MSLGVDMDMVIWHPDDLRYGTDLDFPHFLLHHAAERCHPMVTRRLLDAGADVHAALNDVRSWLNCIDVPRRINLFMILSFSSDCIGRPWLPDQE